MIVKAIYKDSERDYFKDKTTCSDIAGQIKRHYGDIFECDDELAEERIKNGFVEKVNEEEEKEYLDSINTNDENNSKPINDESTKIKPLKKVIADKINKIRAERLKQPNEGEE